MSILHDCKHFADGSFAALVPTLLNSNYLRMYAGMHRGKLPQLLSSSSQPTNLKFAAQHDSLQSFVLIIISNLIKILFSDGRDFLPILCQSIIFVFLSILVYSKHNFSDLVILFLILLTRLRVTQRRRTGEERQARGYSESLI